MIIHQIILLMLILTSLYYAYYKRIDLFTLFMLFKILSLLSITLLIADIYIYNSASVLVCILYIISLKIIKSVIRVVLLIIIKNKHNSFSF